MKNTAKFFVTVVLLLLVTTVSAQVKQVFKVINFDTKQPVAGATTTMFGQTLKTNAQGVAVLTLPADKKGAFLPMDLWKLDGYNYLGRTSESLYKYFQSNDTLKLYMVELPAFRKEVDDVFERLFRFRYNNEVIPTVQTFRDSLMSNPDNAMTFANMLIEAAFEDNSNVRMCKSDASSINKYNLYEYDKPAFREVLRVLDGGDVNKAVEMAREHIDLKDNSPENMEWIEFYIGLRDLDLASDDEEPLYQFSEVLYRNQFHPGSATVYISHLERNREYSKADSIIKIEKPKNRDPRDATAFVPSFVQYLTGNDNPKLKAVSEELLETARKAYLDFPCRTTLSGLFWVYKNLYYSYALMEDSVSATHTIDSALAVANRYFDQYSDNAYSRNQQIIKYYQYLLDVVTVDLRYLPEETVYQLYDGVYNASRDNYIADKDNLFLQLQLAENALLWLKNSPATEAQGEKRTEVLKQLSDLEFVLSKEFPEYYAAQNVQVSSQLLAQMLMNPTDNEELQAAFHQYERSFDEVNALYPKAFIEHYLRFNSLIEGFLQANQQFALTSELTDFTEKLLRVQSDNDPQKLLVAKAKNANEMAESLYNNEMYEESIVYYLKSNELFDQAVKNDETLWIPYLTNYLQMGDAHLYQNQYDKAAMTYKKILDYESRIPASVMPQYTTLKGNVHYYLGDVYKAGGEMKKADSEYGAAEKLFKKAVSLGDTDAYQSLGEMYWGKAVIASQQGNIKKCKQLLEQSVAFYEKTEMTHPLKTYERAKSVLAEFYKEYKDGSNYYRTVADLTDFYRKYIDYSNEYAAKLITNAETMVNSGTVTNEEALLYSRDIMDGLVYLDMAGEDVQLPYLRGMFNLARAYVANDSVLQAVDLYRDCLTLNEIMYKDTAEETYKNNMIEVYSKLANCYELMADEIDTSHAELWNYRAIDTRDTVIELMKDLASDGDVNMTYRTAVQYKNNAVVFYDLDMIPSAQDYLDKSIDLLKMLYNSEYKTEVEEDLILHYYLKGVIYAENNNEEKALENFRIAVDYGDKADTSEGVSRYYFMAVNDLLEHLKKDSSANASEISKLTKKQKELAKWFR